MGTKLKIKCPICKKETNWKENLYRPFCSKECKLADLYHWMSEYYTIKVSKEVLENEKINFEKKKSKNT